MLEGDCLFDHPRNGGSGAGTAVLFGGLKS